MGGSGNGARNWGVTAAATAKVEAAYNKAARLAVGGVPMHTPLAAVYLELGLPEPGDVWARETLRLWRKVASLERGRLPREAWEHARAQGKGNSFVARAEAAHAALMGRPLPAAAPDPGARARAEAKAAVAAALSRRAAGKWRSYVESRADTGMAFYDGAPAPGAAGGFRPCDVAGQNCASKMDTGMYYGHFITKMINKPTPHAAGGA